MHQPIRAQFNWKWCYALLFGLGWLNPSEALANCGISVEGVVYTNAQCGQSDGSAQLVVTGGVQPLTFSWSNGASSATATGLAAGVYSVTISDAGSCTLITQVEVENQGAPVLTNPSANAATCQNNNGSLAFSLTGTAPFSITWTGAASGSQFGAGQGVTNLPNLVAGVYNLIITDANGCSSFEQLTVPQTGNISMNLSALQNPSCAGGNNGVIRAQATSGSLPFEFFLNGVSQGSFFTNINDFAGLSSGTYTITIEDNSGCTVTQTFTLNEVGAIALNPANFAFTNATCPSGNNGTATAVSCPTCEVYNTTTGVLVGTLAAPITNLEAGNYEVRLSTGGCVSHLAFTITDPAGWWVGESISNATCVAGQADIDLSVVGATGAFSYQWSNGATSQDLTNVLPGAYVVTITDGAGCTFTPDTLVVTPCNSVEVITVLTNGTATFCVDTNDVAGNVVSVLNLCPGLVDNGVVTNTIGLNGCINYTASFQEGFDTLCIEVCGASGFDCDTTTVVFVVQSPIDTLSQQVETNQSLVVCPPLLALPGTVVSATNLNCATLTSGTVVNIDPTTACVTYQAGAQAGQDQICVEYCDNLGFCDTAVILIQVYPAMDTATVTVSTGETVTFCPDLSELPAAAASATNLACAVVGNGNITAFDAVTGCVTYQAGNIAAQDQVCIAVCDAQGNCDTTVIFFQSVPHPDTVYIDVPAGSAAFDTCAFNLQFPGNLDNVTNLNCDVNTVGVISVDPVTGCVNYTPPASVPNSGVRADTVCLVLCDDSAPVAFCDTLVFIFNNQEPNCNTGFPATITAQVTDCATGLVCLPIPFDSIGGYNLDVNGQPYTGSLSGCDQVRRIQYPLSLIPPCDSTFSISWVINGVLFGPAVVSGYSGIVAQMNTWDILNGTAWSFVAPDRIVGVSNGDAATYGNLNISCLGQGGAPIAIGAAVQLQYSQGTTVDFGTPGTYTLTVTNPLGCVDVALVNIYCDQSQSEFVTDSIFVGETVTFCNFDSTQLPDFVSIINNCASASTGNVAFTIDPVNYCITYTGDSLGSDIACIVICSSTGICDTTYFTVVVISPIPNAVNDTVNASVFTGTPFSICDNDIVYQSPVTITVLTQPMFGALTGSGCDWTYTVDPTSTECGLDSFTYVLSNSFGSDTATVYLDLDCISTYEAISPNGDGINDVFTVRGIENYPDHELVIFNRWGNMVLRATDYQNDWNGQFNGKDLPDGVFYYLLYLNDNFGTIKTGFLIIQR